MIKSKSILALTVLAFLSLMALSQNDAIVDSLLVDSKSKIQTSPLDAYVSAKKALDLVNKNNYDQLIRAKVYVGRAMITSDKKEEGLIISQEALKLAQDYTLKELEVLALNNIGLYYYLLGIYEKANSYYHQALDISEKLENNILIFQQLNQIAISLIESKEYDSALEYLEKTKKIAEENKFDSYYLKLAYGNISYALLYQKKYAEALPPIEKALELNENTSDNTNQIVGWDMMAQIKNGLGQYGDALTHAEKAIKLSESLNYTDGRIIALNTKGKILLNLKRNNEAISIAKEALVLSNSIKSERFVIDLYTTTYKAYQGIGNYRKAMEYLEIIREKELENNSLQKIELAKKLELEYQVESREKENESLIEAQKKNEIIIGQRTTLFIAAISLVGLLGLTSYLLYNNLKQKKKNNEFLNRTVTLRTKDLENANKELKSSNEELERFAFVASHDLKEPVRNLVSFSTLLKRKLKDYNDEALKEYLSIITLNAQNIYELVDGILNFSRIRNSPFNIKETDLNNIILSIEKLIYSTIDNKNVVITKHNLDTVRADSSQLLLVLKNIIENGIKYNDNEIPKIDIRQESKDGYDIIIISDNGIGIDPKYYKEIFDMFKRLHNKNQYEGTGLGLAISKKIISKHGGTISVRKNDSQGSTFIINLPKSVTSSNI